MDGESKFSSIIVRNKRLVPIALLISILFFQILWHLFLWVSNQNALSTDEYLRLYFSASWAKYPKLYIPGEFLPFYFYIYGTAVNFLGNIVWAGRIVTLLFSLLFSIYYYKLSSLIFNSRYAGILSLSLILSSSLFMKISTVPLSEIGALALIAMSLYYLFLWQTDLESDRKTNLMPLILFTLTLLFANGFRYECWIVTTFSLVFVIIVLIHTRISFAKTLTSASIVCLPFALIILWLCMGKNVFGDPTKFIPDTQSSGSGLRLSNLLFYPKSMALYYPIVLLLYISIVFSIKGFFKDIKKTAILSTSLIFLAFLVYVSARYKNNHMILPERTLLFFVFFAALVATSAFLDITRRSLRFGKALTTVMVTAIIVCFVISFAKFETLNRDPLPNPKRVGLYLKTMDKNGQLDKKDKILLEKTSEDWHVIYVESNLIGRIFFDRKSVLGKRMGALPSQLQDIPTAELMDIINENNISLLVFKSDSLKDYIRKNLKIKDEIKIGDYSIFNI